MQVVVRPSHRGLQHVVQLRQSQLRRHEQQAPDRWVGTEKGNLRFDRSLPGPISSSLPFPILPLFHEYIRKRTIIAQAKHYRQHPNPAIITSAALEADRQGWCEILINAAALSAVAGPEGKASFRNPRGDRFNPVTAELSIFPMTAASARLRRSTIALASSRGDVESRASKSGSTRFFRSSRDCPRTEWTEMTPGKERRSRPFARAGASLGGSYQVLSSGQYTPNHFGNALFIFMSASTPTTAMTLQHPSPKIR